MASKYYLLRAIADFHHPVSQSRAKRRKKLQRTSLLSSYYKEAPPCETAKFEPGRAEPVRTSGVLYYALGPSTPPRRREVPKRRKTHLLRRIPSKRTQALQLVTKKEDQDQEDQFLFKPPPIIERRKMRLNLETIAKKLPIDTSENKDTEQKEKEVEEKEEKPVEDLEYRIIRVKVRDPDATESSSDDNDNNKRWPDGRIHIQEIRIPIVYSRRESRKLEDKVERMRRNDLMSLLTQNPCPKKKRSKRKKRSKTCSEESGVVSSLSSLLDFDIPGPIPDFEDLVVSLGNCMQNFFEDCPEYPCYNTCGLF